MVITKSMRQLDLSSETNTQQKHYKTNTSHENCVHGRAEQVNTLDPRARPIL